ncbi:MAG: hypothetical protein AABO41_09005 [Acidobacteriota bacterium]
MWIDELKTRLGIETDEDVEGKLSELLDKSLTTISGNELVRFLEHLNEGCLGFGNKRGVAGCLCDGENMPLHWSVWLEKRDADALVRTVWVSRKIISGNQRDPNIWSLHLTDEGRRFLEFYGKTQRTQDERFYTATYSDEGQAKIFPFISTESITAKEILQQYGKAVDPNAESLKLLGPYEFSFIKVEAFPSL